MNYLEKASDRKKRILDLLDRTSHHFLKIEKEEDALSLQKLFQQMEKGEFSIVVVGEFSAGKSTFLNAMMGEKYLPSFQDETTATINILKHVSKASTSNSVEIEFKDPTKEILYSDDVSLENIIKYVSTKSDMKVTEDIEEVRVYFDSPFLEKGVILVDSPGLNGIAEGHKEVTERQVNHSHACIYMFSSEQPGKETDFHTLSLLLQKFDSIFLVLNKIDVINPQQDTVEGIVNTLQMRFSEKFPEMGMPDIWPISAEKALLSRSKYPEKVRHKVEDHERGYYLSQSRMEEFEERLLRFLTQGEKAIQEFEQPLQHLETVLVNRKNELKLEMEYLSQNQDGKDLREQQEKLQEQMIEKENEMEKLKQEISSQVKLIIDESLTRMKSEAQSIKTRYEQEIDFWSDLNIIDEELEVICSNINHDYKLALEDLYTTFLQECQDLFESNYNQFIHSIVEKMEGSELLKASFELSSKKAIDDEVLKFDFGFADYDQKKEELATEMEALEQQLVQVEVEQIKAEQLYLRRDGLEQEIQQIQQKEKFSLNILGQRPQVTEKREHVIERVKRGGKIGGFVDNMIGEKAVQKPIITHDYSEQEHYDEEHKKLKDEIKREELRIREEKTELTASLVSREELLIKQKQIARQQEKARAGKKEYEDQYRQQFQQKNKQTLRKIKSEIGLYIRDIRRDAEKQFTDMIRKKRNILVDLMVDALNEKIKRDMDRTKEKITHMDEQLNSSIEEKELLMEGNRSELEILHQLIEEAIELKGEIEEIDIDIIQRRQPKHSEVNSDGKNDRNDTKIPAYSSAVNEH